MRMLTIRRAALLGLLVLGVVLVGCTAKGQMAREHQDEAQRALAERAGVSAEAPAGTATGGAAEGAADDPASMGKVVATQYGCVACHTVDGKAGVGPSWQGLSGHEVELVSGETVTADDDYLRESILSPNAQVVKGFQPNIMPQTFGTQLSPEQIDSVIAYINSLK